MNSRPRSMRFARRSRVIEPSEVEHIPDTEEITWKRKYRQSLNDIDLANKFAEFMPAEIRDNYLDHNKSEFENVLESRPRTANIEYGGTTLPEDYLTAWQDLDMGPLSTASSRRQSKRMSSFHPRTSVYLTSLPPMPPAPVFTEPYREAETEMMRYRMGSKDSTVLATSPTSPLSPISPTTRSRKNSMLRPMRSFVSFLRRPSFK